MPENCYFYHEDDKIRTLCVECSKNHYKKQKLWLWEGAKYGYGPYVFKCQNCKKIIYKPNEENKITD